MSLSAEQIPLPRERVSTATHTRPLRAFGAPPPEGEEGCWPSAPYGGGRPYESWSGGGLQSDPKPSSQTSASHRTNGTFTVP